MQFVGLVHRTAASTETPRIDRQSPARHGFHLIVVYRRPTLDSLTAPLTAVNSMATKNTTHATKPVGTSTSKGSRAITLRSVFHFCAVPVSARPSTERS